MLHRISLLLITLLVALSAHAEIRTSIPDYANLERTSLIPLEADHMWSTTVPSKSRIADERASDFSLTSLILVVTLPTVHPFDKKVFIKQSQNYRSYFERNFHLII